MVSCALFSLLVESVSSVSTPQLTVSTSHASVNFACQCLSSRELHLITLSSFHEHIIPWLSLCTVGTNGQAKKPKLESAPHEKQKASLLSVTSFAQVKMLVQNCFRPLNVCFHSSKAAL